MTMIPTSIARIPDAAPNLAQLAELFDAELSAASFGDERGGILHTAERSILRLGLALEYDEGLAEWANQEKIDALFLHRHWNLRLDELSTGIGILAYHKPYDANLTTATNIPLARELGMHNVQRYGEQDDGSPIGMVGEVKPAAFEMISIRVHHIFGEMDGILAPQGGDRLNSRIAVMSAMSDELVRQASADGIDIYITGQYRLSAAKAVLETGIGVIAIGHARSEQWGLHVLARVAELAFPGLQTAVYRNATSLGKQITEREQSPAH